MSEKEEQVEKDLETTEEPLIEPSEEEIDAAGLSEAEVEKSEIDSLKEKNNELEDQFLRARAEIANITARNRNERELLQKYRSQDLGKKLLPAIDNLERAMAANVEEDQAANLKKGVEMVLESLRQALKEEGIEEIPAEGETFDPNLHQAVQTVPATEDVPADTIVTVLQKGYKLHDRVLRASMVIVAQ
ncbi:MULTISPECIES: nucleotide exchange factor GrpE [Enterococcus]|uniref:nucleotide exchange factor GrpE n=1 Tax=Enterococcus TaxID=1350 RepID=UPI0010FF88B1|nr:MULTISPECIES: nucleotide exchange factor GrpE [Enterococcus]QCT92924.1 nucleotide exchange factor GrpE [Enterococcus sp. M190262]GMG57013.1 nucleotide exchange factor GrpE [Enterococcus gallinarum]